MITSKEDYFFYLEADRIALGIPNTPPPFFGKEIWKFERLLRKVEYYTNCKNQFPFSVYLKYLQLKLHYYGLFLGYSISPNTFGAGLSIAHTGTIVVNEQVRVGENCRIHTCVNIGTDAGDTDDTTVPTLGNNIYIGPGVKMFGKIHIADNIAIGANAVVNKDLTEPGITIAGIPAKKVSDKGSAGMIINATDILRRTK